MELGSGGMIDGRCEVAGDFRDKICEIDGVSVVYQGDVNKRQEKPKGASQRPKLRPILPIVAEVGQPRLGTVSVPQKSGGIHTR